MRTLEKPLASMYDAILGDPWNAILLNLLNITVVTHLSTQATTIDRIQDDKFLLF